MKNHTTNKVCLFPNEVTYSGYTSGSRSVTARVTPFGTGFTLIEIIIAMVLLTIGTLTLLSVLGGGLLQKETSREYDIARNAASAKLEEIRGCDLSNVYTKYNNQYFDVPGLIARSGWTFAGKIVKIVKVGGVEVEYNGIDNTVSDLYEVTITIRWQIKGNTDPRVFNEFVTRSLISRHNKY